MSDDNTTQLAVVGAGPGGYAAAFLAADLGLGVTLIDPAPNPGGVCLYRGCIPSKTLLHVAKLLTEAKEAERWGIGFSEPTIDLAKLRDFKSGVVDKLTTGLGQLTQRRGVRYLRGRAAFSDGHRLEVALTGGGEQKLTFEHAIIATGSVAATVPVFANGSDRVLSSTSALELADVPKRLLVVGGGYIGLELGTVYASLGSAVTVVEMMPGLLPGADADLVRPLKKRLSSLFTDILVNTKAAAFDETADGAQVTFETAAGDRSARVFDRVLVAVGRKPTTSGLGLEHTNVEVDTAGFIRVDPQRRTAEPTIFAIGDVAGQPMLAHKASHEGRTAVEVIAGKPASFAPRAIPAVVFTDPEIAWCGLTETEAKNQGRKVEVIRYPWAASGRAMTMDRTEGMTKVLIDPETERLLGVGIVGVGAGELISEAALALEMEADVTDLRFTIHPHPTLSETLMEAGDLFFGQSTHLYRPKR